MDSSGEVEVKSTVDSISKERVSLVWLCEAEKDSKSTMFKADEPSFKSC